MKQFIINFVGILIILFVLVVGFSFWYIGYLVLYYNGSSYSEFFGNLIRVLF